MSFRGKLNHHVFCAKHITNRKRGDVGSSVLVFDWCLLAVDHGHHALIHRISLDWLVILRHVGPVFRRSFKLKKSANPKPRILVHILGQSLGCPSTNFPLEFSAIKELQRQHGQRASGSDGGFQSSSFRPRRRRFDPQKEQRNQFNEPCSLPLAKFCFFSLMSVKSGSISASRKP